MATIKKAQAGANVSSTKRVVLRNTTAPNKDSLGMPTGKYHTETKTVEIDD